jgi:hypothetical protein
MPDDPSAILRQAKSEGRIFFLLRNASPQVFRMRIELDERRAPRPRNPDWPAADQR